MTQLRLAGAIVGLIALIGAFFYGQSIGVAKTEARYLKAAQKVSAASERLIRSAKAQQEAAARIEARRQSTMREIIREATTIIERPVYRADCIDADGLRLINRAVEAANSGGASGRGTDGDASADPTAQGQQGR